jgi:hypothetical protein
MTYMKLVTGGVKHHLAVADCPPGESMTLCGCLVTQPHSWKLIGGLEGDECEQCAELAFSHQRNPGAKGFAAPRD